MRAATIRGLSRSPTAGVFSEVNEAFTPRSLPNLAAWFDALDTRTMLSGNGTTITDGGAVALWGDKSGNSGTLCYVSGVAASNSVSSPNKSVTGNQTFTLDVGLDDYSPASDLTIVNKLSGNDGFAILLLTTGVVRLRVGDGASVTNVDSTAAVTNTDFARRTIGIAWTDGVGASFTQDGAALGSAVPAAKTLTNAAVACTIGTITGRIYRVQVGSVYDFYPASTTAKKLANGDMLTTGGDVWTLNSSGATGARIAGERDLFQGTLANRPVYLAYAGRKYGYTNGVATNNISTTSAAALQQAGNLDIRVQAGGNWASGNFLVSKRDGTITYQFTNISGTPRLNLNNGSSRTANATAAFTSGTYIGWARATYNATTGDFKFYTSSDGVTWSQLGSTVTGLGTGNITTNTAALVIGWDGVSGTGATTFVYRAQVLFNDVLAADYNPALYTSGTTFTASTGEVWTINGGAHIVARSCNYGDGANDSLKSAAHNCQQPTTIYWVGAMESWTASDYLFDGNATNGGALVQTTSTPQVNLNAGSSAAGNTSAPLKTWGVFCAVLNGASSTLRWMRLAATTGDAGAGNMNGLTLLARGAADAGWFNGVVGEVAQYAGAHDTSIQARWALYAGRRHRFAV